MWTCEGRLVCVFVERLRALGVLFPLRSVMFSFVTYIAIVLPAWKVQSRPFMEQRWNDGTEAVSLGSIRGNSVLPDSVTLFNNISPFFLSFNN